MGSGLAINRGLDQYPDSEVRHTSRHALANCGIRKGTSEESHDG